MVGDASIAPSDGSAVVTQLPSRGDRSIRVVDVERLVCHVSWAGLSDWCSLSETQLVRVRPHLSDLTENRNNILLT